MLSNKVGLWSGCLNRARTGYWELVTALSYLEDWGVNAGPYRDKRMYSFLKGAISANNSNTIT